MKNINLKNALFEVFKLCVLGILIGALGGLVGGCFLHLLAFVTDTRARFPWLILLLPLGSIVTVSLYHILRMSDFGGTNEILQCANDKKPIRIVAAPLIFISTAITHLFGGSAGKEGAAIQLGGTIASAMSNLLRLKETERTVFIKSGMSAIFAAVFGTPLTAAFFVLEFKSTKKVLALSILPCFISSIIAQKISSAIGATSEALYLSNTTVFSLLTIVKIVILAVGLSLLGKVTCFLFDKSKFWAKRLISNPFLRSVLFAIIIVALTAIVGDMRYNGSGMDMAINAVHGNANWYDFILKIIFTAITLAAGFKGGEIVPTFCIGATFGCVLGGILVLDIGFCAALGFVGLFCCATNSPISAVILGIEIFGFTAIPYYLLICLILWPLSVKKGLFDNRFFKPEILWKKVAIRR